jgi:hypothetical protein
MRICSRAGGLRVNTQLLLPRKGLLRRFATHANAYASWPRLGSLGPHLSRLRIRQCGLAFGFHADCGE